MIIDRRIAMKRQVSCSKLSSTLPGEDIVMTTSGQEGVSVGYNLYEKCSIIISVFRGVSTEVFAMARVSCMEHGIAMGSQVSSLHTAYMVQIGIDHLPRSG